MWRVMALTHGVVEPLMSPNKLRNMMQTVLIENAGWIK
jgi:hypothetical protein